MRTNRPNTMQRVHVYIEGRVQGVGFRHATWREALSLGLTGWARNLPDGRVEALFEGNRDDLETMVAWCRIGPGLARVDSVETVWEKATPTQNSFSITF